MKAPTILKIVGLLPIAFLAVVSVVFGIGEAAGGDLSGLMHLVPFIVLALALWLGWKYPLWGGMILLAMALFRAFAFIPELFLRPAGSTWNSGLFLLLLVPAISGGLLLYVGLWERKVTSAKLSRRWQVFWRWLMFNLMIFFC